MRQHLIIFAKAPRVGWVKTRLAHHIGVIEAWRFYRRTNANLLTHMSRLQNTTITLSVTPGNAAYGSSAWPSHLHREPQGAGDIGRRMAAAFQRSPTLPTVLIGSDIPTIRADHIKQAFRRLRHNDLVFGPALDGGFWLVGMRQPSLPYRIFDNVRWSGPHAMQDVLDNVASHTRVGFVETLRDVDELEDYQAAGASCSLRRGINSAKLQGW